MPTNNQLNTLTSFAAAVLLMKMAFNDIPHMLGIFEVTEVDKNKWLVEQRVFPRHVSAFGKRYEVPGEVLSIASANPELTEEQRIQAVSETRWARGIADGQLKLMGIGKDDPVYEKYAQRYAMRVAEGLVKGK